MKFRIYLFRVLVLVFFAIITTSMCLDETVKCIRGTRLMRSNVDYCSYEGIKGEFRNTLSGSVPIKYNGFVYEIRCTLWVTQRRIYCILAGRR